MLRNSALSVAALTLFLTPACAQDTAASGMSKAEVETIVRDYILENPEIIEEALIKLQQKQRLAEEKATRDAIATNMGDLYTNAADYSVGPADAEVTVVEFFDYRCGYCKRSVDWVRALPEEYDGKVRVVFKELPIFGGVSETAALAALAAGEQDKYMELHVAMMEVKSNAELTEAKIYSLAEEVGIDVGQLKQDMRSSAVRKALSDSKALAAKLNVTGTPAFFVDETFVNGANRPALEAAIRDSLG